MPEPGGVMVGGRPRWPALVVLAALALVGVGALGFLLARAGPEPVAGGTPTPTPLPRGASPEDVAAGFLAAWEAEDWEGVQALVADQALDVAGEHERAHRTLGVETTRITAGEPVADGARLDVPYEVVWDLGDLGAVDFATELTLVETADGWRVRWWYPVLHPQLTPNRRLERVRAWPDRAPILDASGEPIVEHVGLVIVGVQPGRMSDGPEPILEALAAHTDADVDGARATLERDDLDPGGFYALATLEADAFAEVRDDLVPVPGIVTRRSRGRVPGEVGALTPLVGRLGEITGELLDELGAPYRAGDTVGRSGLERAFEQRLAGTPDEEARIVEGSNLVATLAFNDGEVPEAVETTLDPAWQAAASATLDEVDRRAAVVLVDAPTGEVRAAAWTGDLPAALSGRYPPGSTFKIVDAAALLAEGADTETRVDCPPEVRIRGRDFTNAGDYGPGEIDLLEAFTRSCNTAFALQMVDHGADGLAQAAGWFGFGVDYDAGLGVFGGSFPEPRDDAELAAAAIGQARVEASPLHMASVAAAARTGTWHAPHLVRGGDVPARDLPAGVAGSLEVLMRAVVASGTGTGAAVAGDPPVAGKTGSAQFGDGSDTHAWFVGHRGDVAIAVLVEGGGAGGRVAAPLAARALAALD